jgi:hypothetical protein
MGNMDFYVDFNIEVPMFKKSSACEAEQQLMNLAADHSDIVGAAVSLESIVKTEDLSTCTRYGSWSTSGPKILPSSKKMASR